MQRLTPQMKILILALILWIQVPSITGVARWAILSAFPKPIPVRHDALVFPKFFTTNITLGLPYLPYDTVTAPLGEDRPLQEKGSLCFATEEETGDCIPLARRLMGWFHEKKHTTSSKQQEVWTMTITPPHGSDERPKYGVYNFSSRYNQDVIWLNGTFLPPDNKGGLPRQPRLTPFCRGEYEGVIPPWDECQSYSARWADPNNTFTFSPNMMADWKDGLSVMYKGLFIQDVRMNPFHKWLLCGVNGSCTGLNPLAYLLGGSMGLSTVSGERNYTKAGWLGETMTYSNVNENIHAWGRSIVNKTSFTFTPVCVYSPFLFILSNKSFVNCTNSTCVMSQCWHAKKWTRAMVARVPRWIPIPVETPSSLSLFRQKRDFGVTAAIVTVLAISAAAATAAGIAMSQSVQQVTTINQLSATVSEAINVHSTATAQLKGGLMIVNQRLDLVEERLDVLFQLAQLGCERKLGTLCITSVQYENFTRAANLSRQLSLYLAGNWSEGFDATLEKLRLAIVAVNSTRIDLSLTEGFSSWISSAFSFFKEWVGVGLFGVIVCLALVFLLWLSCKLRAQQRRDKILVTQALLAIESGASPAVWLSLLRK